MWWWVRPNLGNLTLYWGPTGSVLGPLLFSTFTSPVGHIISSMGVHHQQYADDTQLFISLNSSNQHVSVACLERCLSRLHEWFCLNGLALNPDKSEAIWLSTHQRSRTLPPHKSVDVAGTRVQTSDTLRTLGVTMDSRLPSIPMCPPSANHVIFTFELSATSVPPSRKIWPNQLQSLWLVLALTMPTHFCTALPRVTSTNSRGSRIPLQR